MKLKKATQKALCLTLALLMLLPCAAVGLAPLTAYAAGTGEMDYYDLSEMNMVTNTSILAPGSFSYPVADGGDTNRSAAYLTSWDGAVSEQSDPYVGYESDVVYKECDSVLHIEDIVFIKADIDSVKQALLKYGALHGCYISGPDYYGDNFTNFCRPLLGGYDSGHAITIVGWDDNYSKSNFVSPPLKNGAFLCKNSWGTGTGENGYFYISYYDATLLNNDYSDIVAYVAPDGEQEFNKIYQYDPLGATTKTNRLYGSVEYAANVFPQKGSALESDEVLKAVSFYTTDENVNYDVYIIDNFKDKDDMDSRISEGTCLYTTSGIMEKAGYHTLNLSRDLTLRAGTRFAVVVKLTDSRGKPSYYACETAMDGHSANARSAQGDGYYKASDMVIDLFSEHYNVNWCIKAFTKYTPAGTSPDAFGGKYFSGVDNNARRYTSDKSYSLSELMGMGFEFNSEYVEYVNGKYGNLKGALPSPLGISHSAAAVAETLPERYDLRAFGLVSPVKDQLFLGSCWAFAACASLEGSALKKYAEANGNGVFSGAQTLPTGESKQANISSAGQKRVFSFKAAESGEYTFDLNSASVISLEVCSQYGVVSERKVGSAITINKELKEGETLMLRVGFADALATGSITVLAGSDVYQPYENIRNINTDSNNLGTTQEGMYQRFRYKPGHSNDEPYYIYVESSGEIKVEVNGVLGITEKTVNGSAVIPCRCADGKDEMIKVYPVSGGGVDYSIRVVNNLGYLRTNAAPATMGQEYNLTDGSGDKAFSFTPAESGNYYFAIAYELIYDYLNVYDASGKKQDAVSELDDGMESKIGSYALTGGKVYYIDFDMDNVKKASSGASMRIIKWSAATSEQTQVTEGKYAVDVLTGENDEAVFTFTAAETSDYKICLSSVYSNMEVSITDSLGNKCGDGIKLDDGNAVYYNRINAGETRKISVKWSKAAQDASKAVKILINKCSEASFAASVTPLTPGTAADGSVKSGELKIYRFTAPANEQAVVSVSQNCDVSIYKCSDLSLPEVGSSVFLDSGKTGFICDLEAGTAYYAVVSCPFSDVSVNAYRLVVEMKSQAKARNSTALVPNTEGFATLFLNDENGTDFTFEDVACNGRDVSKVVLYVQTVNAEWIELYSDFGEVTPERVTYDADANVFNYEYGIDRMMQSEKFGKISITAKSLAGSAEIKMSAEVTGKYIFLQNDEIALSQGRGKAIGYTSFYTADELVWSSSDESVATVDQSGKVTAVGIGAARITVSSKDGEAENCATVYVRLSFWQRLIQFILSLFGRK